jgi:hypothetical protein
MATIALSVKKVELKAMVSSSSYRLRVKPESDFCSLPLKIELDREERRAILGMLERSFGFVGGIELNLGSRGASKVASRIF